MSTFEIAVTLSPESIAAINNLAAAFRPAQPPTFSPMSTISQQMPVAPPAYPQSQNLATVQQPQYQVPVQPPAPQQGIPVTPQPSWTMEEIFQMAQQLVSQHGKINEMNELINNKYGVPALELVPQERYAEIANDMMGMGAKPPVR